MKFLHTADWHIGNLFHEYDRSFEHQQFLNWLSDTLIQQHVDVLLISGDIFDISNPSAASLRMFYNFLKTVTDNNPSLQIIITAGNHDSASRLEVAKPLLNDRVHIIGMVERNDDGEINYNNLVIPIKEEGNITGYCLAVPFLRAGDHPAIEECNNPYTEGVHAFYQEAYAAALATITPDQFIIAMGHLHAMSAELSDHDINERAILGGLECISADAFHPGICYVALGHIHKAQRIGGKEHIRYSGSPLPMSFSEINYKHQVICFEINAGEMMNIQMIEVPIAIPLLQVPSKHAPLPEVLNALEKLENPGNEDITAPYLLVKVLLEGPEPGLKHKIDTALKNKYVRLARIDVRYHSDNDSDTMNPQVALDELANLQPVDIFSRLFRKKYNADNVPADMLALFHQASMEVTMKED
ncbi:MAG TPA: exonuclease SbcCD subunit D C-terminal domain-containing protein [Flavitalea sp.]|nr:exonuclease SbcCD subunit D C-terminal domain-containing protein [Flavitalea sp.]